MIELLIAMFLFLIGIVGVLAALPTGIDSALYVILQDASIHLAHSKFAEFRRDRINPPVDLQPGSAYLPTGGSFTVGTRMQEPCNTTGFPWRDFAAKSGEPYENFDDIGKYEWSVDTQVVGTTTSGTPAPPAGFFFPDQSSGAGSTPLNLWRVTIHIRMKNTKREFAFTQYMCAYDPPYTP